MVNSKVVAFLNNNHRVYPYYSLQLLTMYLYVYTCFACLFVVGDFLTLHFGTSMQITVWGKCHS